MIFAAHRQDCNFHECAKLDEFESMRQLSFTPPDGEFVLLNYRINAEFRCPFRLFPSIGDIDPYRCSILPHRLTLSFCTCSPHYLV